MSDPDINTDDLRQFHRHLRVFEDQYDKAQAELRRAASVWIVAALAGVGTIFTPVKLHEVGAEIGLPPHTFLDPFSLIAIVAAFAVMGLGNLWRVDQGVYQQLLHSVFTLGIKVEQRLSRIERVRTTLYAFSENVAVPISNFYKIPLLAFFVMQIVSFALYIFVLVTNISNHGGWSHTIDAYWINVGIGVALAVFVVLSVMFYNNVEKSTRSDDIVTKARQIETYLAGGDFQKTVEPKKTPAPPAADPAPTTQ